MTFVDNLPQNADTLVQRSKTDVQRELDKVDNPNRANVFLKSSWLGAIPTASANRIFDYTLTLREAIRLNMPDTADGEYAERWGAIYVGDRVSATGARGRIVAIGTAGSLIASGSQFRSTEGVLYESDADSTISNVSVPVLSITRVDTLATVTTDGDHGLSSLVPVTIAGSNQAAYNGAKSIQVTGANTFTFDVTGSPLSPATGTITANFTVAFVDIEAVPPTLSDDPFGSSTNQTLDTALTLTSSIPGVNDIVYVDFNELSGGADEESIEDYQSRYISRIQNPIAHFESGDIDQHIRSNVAGVTRTFIYKSGDRVGSVDILSIVRFDVFAKVTTDGPHGLFDGVLVIIEGANEPEYNVDAPVLVISATEFVYIVAGSPSSPATGTITSSAAIALGRVLIYFVRDNDDTIIPSAQEVIDVKNSVLEITPANTPDSYVLVNAPDAEVIDFTFTELIPNTSSMRSAVVANLSQFFSESTAVGAGLDEDAYRSAIFNSIDITTGQSITSFDLSTPTGDIPPGIGKIPILGTVTFP